MAMSLREKLLRKRKGYDEERRQHRFLLDAYTGEGGFAGRFRGDCTDLAGAQAAYGDLVPETYLDKYSREEKSKLDERDKVSYYLNYVEALTDLKIAFMLAKEFQVDGLPDEIGEWRNDVDGQGMTMERARLRASVRSAILGWCPTIIDRGKVPEGVATLAQARTAGVADPRLTFLFPANLTQWGLDGEEMRWLKVRTDHSELESALADEEKEYTRVDVWERDFGIVSTYTLPKKSDSVSEPEVTPFAQGETRAIPVAICRHKESEDDPIRGLPMHGQVSRVARRLFNICSELDENLRGFAFPILVQSEGIDPADDEQKGDSELVIGVGNALTINEDAKQPHYYLAPPASICEGFEKRIEALVREIYRMARTEHVRPAGVADATGIARRYAFAATNAAIASFAANVARWEQEVYVHVGRSLGVSEEKLAAIRVVAPTEFDIEDLDTAIKQTLDAITAGLGPTATSKLRQRLVRQVVPGLDEKTLKKVDGEIEKAAKDAAALVEDDNAFGQSGKKPPKPGEKVPPEEDEPDDEEEDEDDA